MTIQSGITVKAPASHCWLISSQNTVYLPVLTRLGLTSNPDEAVGNGNESSPSGAGLSLIELLFVCFSDHCVTHTINIYLAASGHEPIFSLPKRRALLMVRQDEIPRAIPRLLDHFLSSHHLSTWQ